MKRNLFLTGLLIATCLVFSSRVVAQDVIYFDDGSPLPETRITDVTDKKVILTRQLDGISKDYPFGRGKILLAFTKAGNYLIVSELSADAIQAKQQIQTFLAAPPRNDGNDYLIKAVPLTVIPVQKIAYESDEIVNYTTRTGNAASISKSELIAILYRDGRHLLTAQAGEAAPFLADARPMLNNEGKPAPSNGSVSPPIYVSPKPGLVLSQVPQSATQTTAPTPVSATEQTVSKPVATTPPTEIPAPTPPRTSFARPKLTLTEEEKEGYRQKSLLRVEEFVAYINIITDKSINNDDKDRAIEQAARLFMPESTIEVTSTQRAGSRKMSVKQYLTRLKILPYTSTKIEWVQTQFVRDLMQEADGNYYGTITGQQTFIGYDANGKPQYSDITPKSVKVKLDSYQTVMDGKEYDKWRVLLGNVSVDAGQN